MKHSMMSAGLVALIALSAQAVANDAVKAGTPNKSQAMKDCMDRQKASNSGLTQSAMETVCKNEAKGNGQKNGNDLATGPKSNTPDK